MSKHSPQSWLTIQEHRKNHLIFLVEWLAMFMLAWLFWLLMFLAAPGSVPPWLAALLVSALYATCMIYGRLLRATGCRKCSSALPFLRKEVGRRHLRAEEDCIEAEYGTDDFGQRLIQVYSKIVRADLVTYRCRNCGQTWEERVELSGPGYELVRRTRQRQ